MNNNGGQDALLLKLGSLHSRTIYSVIHINDSINALRSHDNLMQCGHPVFFPTRLLGEAVHSCSG